MGDFPFQALKKSIPVFYIDTISYGRNLSHSNHQIYPLLRMTPPFVCHILAVLSHNQICVSWLSHIHNRLSGNGITRRTLSSQSVLINSLFLIPLPHHPCITPLAYIHLLLLALVCNPPGNSLIKL